MDRTGFRPFSATRNNSNHISIRNGSPSAAVSCSYTGNKKALPAESAPIICGKRLLAQEISNELVNLRLVNLSSNNLTGLVYKDVLRDISHIIHLAHLIVPILEV